VSVGWRGWGTSGCARRGVIHAPPLDTQSVSATAEVSGTTYQFAARYFVNRPGTLAWLDFTSNDDG
jgi:hypothetical protein